MSRVGKVCENSIDKESICISSANQVNKFKFMRGNGTGVDLPYGCILDKTNPETPYIYWNPNGVAISADPQIREICLEKEDPLEGNKFRYLTWKISFNVSSNLEFTMIE